MNLVFKLSVSSFCKTLLFLCRWRDYEREGIDVWGCWAGYCCVFCGYSDRRRNHSLSRPAERMDRGQTLIFDSSQIRKITSGLFDSLTQQIPEFCIAVGYHKLKQKTVTQMFFLLTRSTFTSEKLRCCEMLSFSALVKLKYSLIVVVITQVCVVHLCLSVMFSQI